MLAEALRRRQIEVLFIVDSKEPLHRPEFRCEEIKYPYPEWIREICLNPKDLVLHSHKKREAVTLLRSCDAVVLNGYGPSLHSRIHKPALVMLTGSDLEVMADYYAPQRLSFKGKLALKLLTYHQRQGIKGAKLVNYFPPGVVPNGDRLLEELGISSNQRIYFQMTDTHSLKPEPLPHNSPIRIFCATRFMWVKPVPTGYTDLDYKGSDIMIRGLALFWKKFRTQLDVQFVEKGLHIEQAKELIRELCIEHYITWHKEMSQSQVYDEIRKADIILDQFGTSCPGMAALDAMALGRPVIANARIEIMEAALGTSTAICHATTPTEVCMQLERLVFDKEERESVAKKSRKFVEEYHSSDLLADFLIGILQS